MDARRLHGQATERTIAVHAVTRPYTACRALFYEAPHRRPEPALLALAFVLVGANLGGEWERIMAANGLIRRIDPRAIIKSR